MSKASAPFWAATLIVLLFGASVRLYKLDSYPIGFNQDQMVLGYDAWSIWQTGRDHHGQALPLFFRTFDDYVSPVANYLTSPFVGLLGLNEFNTRLPIAILGALTVLLVALLGREWFGPGAGIVAALLFAIEPWQVNYNRIAYPANLIPFFTTASLYCFTKAMAGLRARRERSAYGWLAACSVSFALLTATYAIMKLQGPLLLFICVLASLTLLRRHPRAAFGWLILFTLCISPLIVQQILQWNTSQARFAAITATNARDANYGQLPYTIRLYASHFDPRTIFFTGFRNSVRFPPTIGELSWVEIPLLIGFILFNRLRQQSNRLGFNLTLLVVLWLLTYPIADTLTGGFYGTASEVRCVPIMPLPELLAGYGALLIWQRLVQHRRRLAYAALAMGATAYGVFAVIFLFNFFDPTQYNAAQLPFNVGLKPMLDIATQNARPCDQIWMDSENQPYMYYLFLEKYPPGKFQKFSESGITSDSINSVGFDNVRFGIPPDNPSELVGCKDQPYRVLWVTRTISIADWSELSVYRNPVGILIWHVVVKQIRLQQNF